MKKILFKKSNGASLVELLVTIGLASILLPALILGFMASRDGRAQQEQRVQALNLLKEAQEAARSVRDEEWNTFAVNGIYYPRIATDSSWELVAGQEIVNGFTRQIEIEDVYRLNGAIVTSGGILDPSTKRVITTISWNSPLQTSVTSELYLTRYLSNDSYTETTQAEFNAGTKTGVTVRATSSTGVPDDGEIVLGAGGNSDWCFPGLTTSTLNLPGQGYASSVTAIEGKAFVGTGENASGYTFMEVDINNASPPNASLGGTFDGYKTNEIFGEEEYGYVATDTNSKEVVILDVSGSSFSEAGSFDAPGNSDGLGVFVLNNVGYVTVANRLYSFDLSSKSGSRPIRDPDGVTLAGQGTDLYVVGNYAYVAISGSSTTELQIIDVSNPNNLTVVGQANTNSASATDIFVDSSGNRAYLSTAASSTQQEMFIIDVSSKTGNRPIVGSYEANGMSPKGVTVVPGNRAIIVGTGGEEYQVINISNEATPTRCGGIHVDTGVHSVAGVLESDGDAYSYIVTGDADTEFKIIAGGPGGSYASVGEYESQTLAPPLCSTACANNRLSATFSEPPGTNITFQVGLANMIGGVCPANGGYTFIGPGGTSSPTDVFDQASGDAITFPFGTVAPSYSNPGQCFRYKAYFTTSDSGNTPVLYDVTLNYSP